MRYELAETTSKSAMLTIMIRARSILAFVSVAVKRASFYSRTGVDWDHCSKPGSRLVKRGGAWWNTSPCDNLRDDRPLRNQRISGSANRNQ